MTVDYVIEYDSLDLKDIQNKHKKESYKDKEDFDLRLNELKLQEDIMNVNAYKLKISDRIIWK